MNIILEGGKIRISEKTIEEFAKIKGLNLKCKIEEEEVKIEIEMEFFGFEVPIHIFIPEIEYENFILKAKNFKVLISSMPVPYISLIPFIKKYDFLAIDVENKVLNINIKNFIPEYLTFEIDEILTKKGEIEIKIKELTISLLNLVTK